MPFDSSFRASSFISGRLRVSLSLFYTSSHSFALSFFLSLCLSLCLSVLRSLTFSLSLALLTSTLSFSLTRTYIHTHIHTHCFSLFSLFFLPSLRCSRLCSWKTSLSDTRTYSSARRDTYLIVRDSDAKRLSERPSIHVVEFGNLGYSVSRDQRWLTRSELVRSSISRLRERQRRIE